MTTEILKSQTYPEIAEIPESFSDLSERFNRRLEDALDLIEIFIDPSQDQPRTPESEVSALLADMLHLLSLMARMMPASIPDSLEGMDDSAMEDLRHIDRISADHTSFRNDVLIPLSQYGVAIAQDVRAVMDHDSLRPSSRLAVAGVVIDDITDGTLSGAERESMFAEDARKLADLGPLRNYLSLLYEIHAQFIDKKGRIDLFDASSVVSDVAHVIGERRRFIVARDSGKRKIEPDAEPLCIMLHMPERLQVVANPAALMYAVMTAIRNAIDVATDAAPKRDLKALTIDVRVEEFEGILRVRVTDNGPGCTFKAVLAQKEIEEQGPYDVLMLSAGADLEVEDLAHRVLMEEGITHRATGTGIGLSRALIAVEELSNGKILLRNNASGREKSSSGATTEIIMPSQSRDPVARMRLLHHALAHAQTQKDHPLHRAATASDTVSRNEDLVRHFKARHIGRASQTTDAGRAA